MEKLARVRKEKKVFLLLRHLQCRLKFRWTTVILTPFPFSKLRCTLHIFTWLTGVLVSQAQGKFASKRLTLASEQEVNYLYLSIIIFFMYPVFRGFLLPSKGLFFSQGFFTLLYLAETTWLVLLSRLCQRM